MTLADVASLADQSPLPGRSTEEAASGDPEFRLPSRLGTGPDCGERSQIRGPEQITPRQTPTSSDGLAANLWRPNGTRGKVMCPDAKTCLYANPTNRHILTKWDGKVMGSKRQDYEFCRNRRRQIRRPKVTDGSVIAIGGRIDTLQRRGRRLFGLFPIARIKPATATAAHNKLLVESLEGPAIEPVRLN